MKKFLIKLLLFCILIIVITAIPLFYIPNRQFNNSILAVLPDKHKMLASAISPKIVFVGGSNVSMSLNSKMVADAYHLPVINNSIALWLGLKFMINDVKPFINKGDIIVLSPEYSCYDESLDKTGFEGYEPLLTVLFEIYPAGEKYIDAKQWLHLLEFVPHYIASAIKYDITDRRNPDLNKSPKKDFNQYGDLYTHWSQAKIPYKTEDQCTGNEKLNPDVIPFLKKFHQYVLSKGATLVILPPPLQSVSYKNQYFIIQKIALALKQNGLPLLADPGRYKFDDKYTNDFSYHLTKVGVDIRTKLVIEDLAKVIH